MYVEYLSHRCHGMVIINNIYIYNVCVKEQTHIHNKIEKKKKLKKKKKKKKKIKKKKNNNQQIRKKKKNTPTIYLYIYLFINQWYFLSIKKIPAFQDDFSIAISLIVMYVCICIGTEQQYGWWRYKYLILKHKVKRYY